MDKYIPPFELTNEMFELTTRIMENIGSLFNVNEFDKLPKLRKVSRIKSIYSSLSIENNTLSIEQVSDVIDGKNVLGPKEDIIAVKNAYESYDLLDEIDPYSLSDLLKIHKIMMKDLISNAGTLRQENVGVYDEYGNVIHMAPPFQNINELINQLFDWLKTVDVQMLIKSSVFHYEFEFIHPFNDGNGRMGRLWQTALLASWKPIFKYIPIESVIKNNQEKYYESIAKSTREGNSNTFIVFMLEIIDKAVKDMVNDSKQHYYHMNIQMTKLMNAMETYPQTTQMIMNRLKLKSRLAFRNNYLNPALEAGLIKMTIPNKPTSKNQMYYKVH